jgi:3-deoxy-D-manno-octulosonate 8-phosphate phosphatase (KDO 8-P phosphatase)
VAEAKAAAHFVTRAAGGRGAVREVVEMILRVQGKWNAFVAHYSE